MNITRKQAEAYNRMRAVLIKIHKYYMKPSKIRRDSGGAINYEEYLEMSYENIQDEARAAVKGVRELQIKEGGYK